jgi:hypothetical protein
MLLINLPIIHDRSDCIVDGGDFIQFANVLAAMIVYANHSIRHARAAVIIGIPWVHYLTLSNPY